MRNMNAGDKAFFYHSNCKEPGIVGIMEIVREYSEDSKFPFYAAACQVSNAVF
jgi:predicted RNA-binding protein with PUA-like domain